MADQTARLEAATVKAEVGSDIVYRFSNDAEDADPIPTLSGNIENLKQVIDGVKANAADAVNTAVSEGIVDLSGSVLAASQSAARADSSASMAASFSHPFPSTAEGLANTSGSGATNRFFSVPGTGDSFAIAYRNDAGVAVEIGQTPNTKSVPKIGVEGSYNLVNPGAVTVSGFGINSSSNYGALATSKSIAIRVDEGSDIVISNTAGNYSAAAGYGAAFFSDLPTTSNRVAVFNSTVLTNLSGSTYKADKVPSGAKYLVVNTEFQSVQNIWFSAYGTDFSGVVAFSPVVARVNDVKILDRDTRRKIDSAFSSVEGSDNLYSPSNMLVGYIQSTGAIARNNPAWRYIRIPVVEGRTYAIYTSSSAWIFPVAGSYSVSGADPIAGSLASLVETADPLVRTFTVPSGTGITHFLFNVYIKPPGGDIDFTSTLIIREGSSVPVRPLPYIPVLAKINGVPLKDSQARTSIVALQESVSQRTGQYNLIDPSASTVTGKGLDGSSNYVNLSTAKSLAIPVTEGRPIVISNPFGTYRAPAGYGAAFFSGLPTSSNKVRAFNNPLTEADTITLGNGLTYRKDVVPAGAKYLVLNTEFNAVNLGWFAGYDTGFTAPEAFSLAVSRISGLPIVDRDTQILAKSNSRLVNKRFNGKKVYYFGDSITQGNPGVFTSYTNRVTEILQCSGTNYGSSGAKTDRLVGIMTNLNPRDGTSKIYNPDYTDVAAVTIMIGTNDASSTGNITGSLSDIPSQRVQDLPFTTAGGVVVTTPDDYWALFPNTYYGNLSLCIEYVKWKNPLTVIYLISATQRPSGPGITTPPMEAVVIAMTAIGRFYATKYLDATHECGLDLKGIDTWSPDKLHPNNAIGVPRIGDYVGYGVLYS